MKAISRVSKTFETNRKKNFESRLQVTVFRLYPNALGTFSYTYIFIIIYQKSTLTELKSFGSYFKRNKNCWCSASKQLEINFNSAILFMQLYEIKMHKLVSG